MVKLIKLIDDVENVMKSYMTDLDRLNTLRLKYSNGFLTSGLQRKSHTQLELIYTKIISMIDTEFVGKRKLFNTLEIKENVLNAMKHKSGFNNNEGIKLTYKKVDISRKRNKHYDCRYDYVICSYDKNWRMWDEKETKNEKINRIIHLLQRMCDIVNMEPIECIVLKGVENIKLGLVTTNYIYVIRRRMIYTKRHPYYIELVTKFIILMGSIVNKTNTGKIKK
jgi:hypothetical protein